MTPMVSSDLPLRRLGRGKVRDLYEVDATHLLLVATDRVSAFDVVMREAIPFKGAVLTQLSAWWFAQVADIVPTHIITARAPDIVRVVPSLAPPAEGAGGPRDALPARHGLSDRVRHSRLYFRLGVEGVREVGHAGR